MSDAWVPLPTNTAETYPSRGAGDLAHLEHHDQIHAALNLLMEWYEAEHPDED